MRQIVNNTGPLISLEKLSQGYDFIRQLYDQLIIAPVVLEGVAAGQFATPGEYLQHYGIGDLIEVRTVSQPYELPEADRLHEGETQAIQLALELQLPLLIEETVERRVAQSVGIQISGIAGQILKAFRQGIISATEAQTKLSELLRAGRINRKVYDALLAALTESGLHLYEKVVFGSLSPCGRGTGSHKERFSSHPQFLRVFRMSGCSGPSCPRRRASRCFVPHIARFLDSRFRGNDDSARNCCY